MILEEYNYQELLQKGLNSHFFKQEQNTNSGDRDILNFRILSPLPKAPCKRTQHCWMLHVASVCTPCCMFLDVVACCCAKFETGQTFQPTFQLLFLDRRSLAQQCSWIRLHSSSNIVGATHAHCAWFTKTDGLYPSHGALQVPKLLGVVASVCTPLPTRAQQCWELLRPFAHHRQHARNNSRHCWRNNAGSCCVRLHAA